MLLDTPLDRLIGGRSATALGKAFGMSTAEDLLRHYPRRYAERGELTDLRSLVDGEAVTVLAEVAEVTVRPMRARRGSILEAVVTDGHGSLSLTFFNQKWREGTLKPGQRGLFAGQVSTYRGRRQLAHPQFQLFPDGVDDDPDVIEDFAGVLIPVYPATAQVTSWDVARAVRVVIDGLGEVEDPLPAVVRSAESLVGLADALRLIHRPGDRAQADQARHRLAYEEAFVLQAVLAQRRAQAERLPATSRATTGGALQMAFDARMPFTLTSAQRAVGDQIAHDLSATHPMHRLLQGDVGSGKTLVALRAMLGIVDAGGQAALLAPTEVLATQHHRSITNLLGPLAEAGMLGSGELGTKVALLTGSQTTSKRRRELLDVISGDAGIVVGTHALLEDTVEFRDLALVVIDEQHRFGVEQRAMLAAKSRDGTRPHVLVMTATPIPRTVAMTVFGDLDISTLDELPAGRSPITTHVVSMRERPAHLQRAWQRVREEASAGHRVFVVCPRIGDDGSEVDEPLAQDDTEGGQPISSVIALAEELAVGPLAGLRIGVLHGRMSGDEKATAMRRFADPSDADALDVLVSTTVIEVGVDVPIATMMVIMDADRFGISQLHQLRGRVGRGGLPGLCLLVTWAWQGSPARERLIAVASTTDGFELAALDLRMRKEGDVLGALQSGRQSSLRLLEVVRDAELIERARDAVTPLIAADPDLHEHPALATAIAALVRDEQADYLEKA